MIKLDRFGAPVSGRNQPALDLFDDAATLMLGFREDPLATIEHALRLDPDFVMGYCFLAGLFVVSTEADCEAELKDILKQLRRLEPVANERERAHIAAIRAWTDRQFHTASDLYGRILFDYPRDIVAMQIAHQTDFLLGQQTMLRDRVRHILPAWSETDPEFGYLLGIQAFGLEECGHYAEAEATGKRAIALNPYDAWAYHAVAHVYEMQGRPEEGTRWLSGSAENWSPRNMLAYHNWWHLALYHLEMNETATVMALYDHAIRPTRSTIAMEMVDAAAMLWRLHLRDVDVGNRWVELADLYEKRLSDAYHPFNDAHAMMALAATDRYGKRCQLIGTLEDAAGDGTSSARLIRDVGLPVARAIHDFGEADYESCFDILLDVRKRAGAFGGSNAQRDVLNLTLLESAIRAGNMSAAAALINERQAAKPESPFVASLSRRVKGIGATATHESYAA
jgi:tetratricopeptide (TPR) repeat protein